jgi:hypothetical protein
MSGTLTGSRQLSSASSSSSTGTTANYLQPPDEETFVLWPADDVTLQLEIEAWLMFVDWNDRYDAATATADSHPGRGGINARYDEIEQLLQSRRVPPEGAPRRRAQWRGTGASKRYGRSGPDYEVRWYGVDSRGEA